MPYKPFKNEETRTSVLSGVSSGAEAAWGRFFDLYAGYVFSLANRAGLIGTDADDLVQTVFAELAKPNGFDGYERGKGAFRSWLRRRVEWRIADTFRLKAKTPRADIAFGGDPDRVAVNPDDARDELWRAAALDEAMRRLRAEAAPDHFAIFQASVVEELPTEDVMALYHVSRDNLYQIRRRMKAALERHYKAALADLDEPTI
jgi:RNA polymerase sigma factor (sigma-70 family)